MLGNVRVFAFNALPSNPDRSGSCADASYAGDDIASAVDRGTTAAPTRRAVFVPRVVNVTRRTFTVDDAEVAVIFFVVVANAPRIIERVAVFPVVAFPVVVCARSVARSVGRACDARASNK